MGVCIAVYVLLIILYVLKKKGLAVEISNRIFLIVTLCNTIALGLFLAEMFAGEVEIERNNYGDGSKVEAYEFYIPEENIRENIEIEISEQEYSREEIQEIFREILEELDSIVLGENKSFDRVEQDLQLVDHVEGRPVEITWELDSYTVMGADGRIRRENLKEEGTLIELRGTLSYLEEQAVYVRHAMVYPETLKGTRKLLAEIETALKEAEFRTRKDAVFLPPRQVSGVNVEWSHQKEGHGYYVILIGITIAALLIYKEKDDIKQKKLMRERELQRAYPGLVSKLTMLLGTGMTIKQAWQKTVDSYEQQKDMLGESVLYEEMAMTLHEMKSGITEGEAYERFGKRCDTTIYLKLGAMLSQNLRKGSRGLSDMLRMEAIQSFENRKNMAKQTGEQAGTKLLLPMLGMLAVVLIMVMVPAFLTMQ